MAVDWRHEFKKDVVIDLVCYRRHGHNEIDQPAFTQPRMYKAIENQKPTLEQYSKRLVDEGSLSQKEIDDHLQWVWNLLQERFEKSKTFEPEERQWLSSAWEGFPSPRELKERVLEQHDTGVDDDRL